MEKNFDGVYKAGSRDALQKASQAITNFLQINDQRIVHAAGFAPSPRAPSRKNAVPQLRLTAKRRRGKPATEAHMSVTEAKQHLSQTAATVCASCYKANDKDEDPDVFWLGCDDCPLWFHSYCIPGITVDMPFHCADHDRSMYPNLHSL